MYFQFGNYQHASNEVDVTNLTIQRMYSPRNYVFFQRHTLAVVGHFCVTGQSSIKAAIEELEEAYKLRPGGVNGNQEGCMLDAGLYHDDGTASAHFLDASNAINGVRLQALSYGRDDGEYATGRSYSIVLQADYLNPENPLYSYHETIQYIGNCGPQWELVPVLIGEPQLNYIAEWTVQRIVQQGAAVGIEAPTYPQPEYWGENYKHGEQSFWEYETPQLYGRRGASTSGLLYPCRWRYVFSSVTKQDQKPAYDHV